jgi:hypothetical protein
MQKKTEGEVPKQARNAQIQHQIHQKAKGERGKA